MQSAFLRFTPSGARYKRGTAPWGAALLARCHHGAASLFPCIFNRWCQFPTDDVSKAGPFSDKQVMGLRDAECSSSIHFKRAKDCPFGRFKWNSGSRLDGDGGYSGGSNGGRGEACLRPTDWTCLYQMPHCASRTDKLRQSLQSCGQSGAKKEEVSLSRPRVAEAWRRRGPNAATTAFVSAPASSSFVS